MNRDIVGYIVLQTENYWSMTEQGTFLPQWEADADLVFEEHRGSRVSQLEPHRVAIGKMRQSGWPYSKVVDWLRDERGIKSDPESVRNFCLVRKIEKGVGETEPPDSMPVGRQAASPPKTSVPGSKRRKPRHEAGKSAPAETAGEHQKEWNLVVPKFLETWKSRGEDGPPG